MPIKQTERKNLTMLMLSEGINMPPLTITEKLQMKAMIKVAIGQIKPPINT